MNIHNYKIGPIKTCQICNTSKISKVMDFGYQPLADDLIHKKNNQEKLFFILFFHFKNTSLFLGG